MLNFFKTKPDLQFKHSIGRGAKGGCTEVLEVPTKQQILDKLVSGMSFELRYGFTVCPRKRKYVKKLGAKYAVEAIASVFYKVDYIANSKDKTIAFLRLDSNIEHKIDAPYEIRLRLFPKSEKVWFF